MTSCWQVLGRVTRTWEKEAEQYCHPFRSVLQLCLWISQEAGGHSEDSIGLNAAPCQIPLLHVHGVPHSGEEGRWRVRITALGKG